MGQQRRESAAATVWLRFVSFRFTRRICDAKRVVGRTKLLVDNLQECPPVRFDSLVGLDTLAYMKKRVCRRTTGFQVESIVTGRSHNHKGRHELVQANHGFRLTFSKVLGEGPDEPPVVTKRLTAP